jgi:hypothetical protein
MKKNCLIMLGPIGWDNERVLRYEMGHCTGWPSSGNERVMEKFSATKPCPICSGEGSLPRTAWTNARSYSSKHSKRVKCWNCRDGFVPSNMAYKIVRKAAEYPAVSDTFTVIDVASCDSLSHHESEAEARAAVRRYEQADTRRKWGQV